MTSPAQYPYMQSYRIRLLPKVVTHRGIEAPIRLGRVEDAGAVAAGGSLARKLQSFVDRLMKRHGKQSGTRQMIDVLKLDRQHGYGRLREAVELTLQSGSHDVCAIRYLLSATQRSATQLPVMELGLVGRYEGCVAIVLGPV